MVVALNAKVFLPNSELGFIKDGMPVKLAVSSFPPGEYGYLKGSGEKYWCRCS